MCKSGSLRECHEAKAPCLSDDETVAKMGTRFGGGFKFWRNLKFGYGSRRSGGVFYGAYREGGQGLLGPVGRASRRMVNSAGLVGAKPMRRLTILLSMSFCVVVARSHWTKKASAGLEPMRTPWTKRVI